MTEQGRTITPSPTLLEAAEDRSDDLQRILDEATHTLRGVRSFVALVDGESGELVVKSVAGDDWSDDKRARRLQIGQQQGKGITAYVAASGKPYGTGDVRKDPYYLEYFDDVMSEIAVPLLDSHGRTIGVINVESDNPGAFDDRDERFVDGMCVV